jgi:hypothetical protein
VRVLPDSRDLINLLERDQPVSVKDFMDILIRAGHRIVLTVINVNCSSRTSARNRFAAPLAPERGNSGLCRVLVVMIPSVKKIDLNGSKRGFSHPAVPLPFGTIDTEFLFVIILAVLVGLGI